MKIHFRFDRDFVEIDDLIKDLLSNYATTDGASRAIRSLIESFEILVNE